MPTLKTQAAELFFARRGSGAPTLLCIHGAGGTHQHWGRQLQGLAPDLDVVAIDLPGHGRSAGAGHAEIAAYGATVLAALDVLGLEQVWVAGHSMGGAVALWLALTAAKRVTGLVLIGSGARLPVPAATLTGLRDDPQATLQLIGGQLFGSHAPADLRERGIATFIQNDLQVVHGDLAACNAFDVRTQLAAIGCPTLVVCGDEDRMVPLRFSQSLARSIAGAQLVTVRGAGHMVMLEQPAPVNQAIAAFIFQYRND